MKKISGFIDSHFNSTDRPNTRHAEIINKSRRASLLREAEGEGRALSWFEDYLIGITGEGLTLGVAWELSPTSAVLGKFLPRLLMCTSTY